MRPRIIDDSPQYLVRLAGTTTGPYSQAELLAIAKLGELPSTAELSLGGTTTFRGLKTWAFYPKLICDPLPLPTVVNLPAVEPTIPGVAESPVAATTPAPAAPEEPCPNKRITTEAEFNLRLAKYSNDVRTILAMNELKTIMRSERLSGPEALQKFLLTNQQHETGLAAPQGTIERGFERSSYFVCVAILFICYRIMLLGGTDSATASLVCASLNALLVIAYLINRQAPFSKVKLSFMQHAAMIFSSAYLIVPFAFIAVVWSLSPSFDLFHDGFKLLRVLLRLD